MSAITGLPLPLIRLLLIVLWDTNHDQVNSGK